MFSSANKEENVKLGVAREDLVAERFRGYLSWFEGVCYKIEPGNGQFGNVDRRFTLNGEVKINILIKTRPGYDYAFFQKNNPFLSERDYTKLNKYERAYFLNVTQDDYIMIFDAHKPLNPTGYLYKGYTSYRFDTKEASKRPVNTIIEYDRASVWTVLSPRVGYKKIIS